MAVYMEVCLLILFMSDEGLVPETSHVVKLLNFLKGAFSGVWMCALFVNLQLRQSLPENPVGGTTGINCTQAVATNHSVFLCNLN